MNVTFMNLRCSKVITLLEITISTHHSLLLPICLRQFIRWRYSPVAPVMSGGHSELEPPLPISNRAVKRFCANDSMLFACESRSPPGFYPRTLVTKVTRVFSFLLPKTCHHTMIVIHNSYIFCHLNIQFI